MASRNHRGKRRLREADLTGTLPKNWTSPRSRKQAFPSMQQVVEAIQDVLRARSHRGFIEDFDEDTRDWSDREKKAQQLTQVFHDRLGLMKSQFTERLRKAQLEPVETEALIVTALYRIGLCEEHHEETVEGLFSVLRSSTGEKMRLINSLNTGGRLASSEMLIAEGSEDEENFKEYRLELDPEILGEFIQGKQEHAIEAATEAELYRWLRKLTQAIRHRSVVMQESSEDTDRAPARRADHAMQRQLTKLRTFLEGHRDWGLSKLLHESAPRSDREAIILLALVGKALSHFEQKHPLFTGEGLAWAVTPRIDEMLDQFEYLQSQAPLVKNDLIRPCGGQGHMITDKPDDLLEAEFELTQRAMDLLGIECRDTMAGQKAAGVREALIRLDQLVLAEPVREALDMALAQARNHHRLMTEWGFGKSVAYGRAVTMLFEGPPGVGKTAAAEALAAELDLPILVADYSRIQNCFVGETEKRIMGTFRDAARYNAVLFWDEADAMFSNRDHASHDWDVRNINVLLTELERFEGVCILATNRKLSLDPALERRISLKVPFTRPDAVTRPRIWGKLIPAGMPLAEDVDRNELSRADLTGGQIKNVILNAARRALARGPEARVAMDDFREAVRIEVENSFAGGQTPRFGFHARLGS